MKRENLNEIYEKLKNGISFVAIAQDLNTSHQLVRHHIKNYCNENNLDYPRFKRGAKKSADIFKKKNNF